MHKKPHPSHPAYRTRPAHQVFPEDIDCVLEPSQGLGAIYIGNLQAAENPETLKQYQIGSLLTACKNIHIKHPKEQVPFILYIPGQDHQQYDLSLHFDTAINFIHQSRKETNILVHCMAGISRSATLVLAYLMKQMGMTLKEAFSKMLRKRGRINPNPGFLRQLKKYESQLQLVQGKYKTDNNNYKQRSQYQSQYTPYQLRASYYDSADRSQSLGRRPVTNYLPTQPNPQSQASCYSNYSNYSNSSLRQSLKPYSSKPFQQKTNQSYGNISRQTKYATLAACDSSIQTLSRDLEDRINKIKQKYYQKSYQENYQPQRFDRSMRRSSLEASKVERTLQASRGSSAYRNRSGVGFERSGISFGERDSMLGSLYNGGQRYRPLSFNYSYMGTLM